MIDLAAAPVALFRRPPRGVLDDWSQQIGTLWENRIRESLRLSERLQSSYRSCRLGKKTMQRDIEPKARSLPGVWFNLHHHPPGREQNMAPIHPDPVQLSGHRANLM